MEQSKNIMKWRASILRTLLILGLLLGLGQLDRAFSQSPNVLQVPNNYKTEGIPAIKKSDVEHLFYPPENFGSNLIWDADRKNRQMLVTDDTNHVFHLEKPLSKPIKLIENLIPNSVKMRPTGGSFAYTSDFGDEDNYQIYLYDLSKKSSTKLITLTGKDESIDSYTWSRKGEALFYTRVDYDSKGSKICRYDFSNEKCFDVELRGIWNIIESWDSNLLLKYWKTSSSQLLYVFNTKTNQLKPIDETGNSRKAFLKQDIVFWLTEGNQKCKSEPCVLTQKINNSPPTQLAFPSDINYISDLKISPKGNYLLLQGRKDSSDYLRIFEFKDNKLGSEIPSIVSGADVIWNTRWLSNAELVYTLENTGKPASISSYNINTRKITIWTNERLPEVLRNRTKKPQIFKWKSFDEKDISGYILRPQNNINKAPVLIYVHGGPQIFDKPIFNSEDLRLAANLGLSIIHTNIRGSAGFGKDFLDLDNKERRGDAVKDIRSLIDWIEKQPDLNSNQIYLRGESYGGFVALSAALQEPERIRGVIAESPLVSISNYLKQSWIDEYTKSEYGDPEDKTLMAKLDNLSPLNNVKNWNQIPLFLTRGKNDQRIPEKDVTDLKNQLQNKNTEVWYIFALDGGHGFSSDYVFAAMYEFIKKQISKGETE